eukprot:SM000049S16753  [mRNA]  locus=s49:507669:508864:+ [translate_table: standard]
MPLKNWLGPARREGRCPARRGAEKGRHDGQLALNSQPPTIGGTAPREEQISPTWACFLPPPPPPALPAPPPLAL